MQCPHDFRTLDFPLNAYACALWLEQAQVDYLHYGFNPDDGGMSVAQQRSTDFLLQRIRAAPARVLEVGIGLGSTAKQLRARGYHYTGVTPDAQQITYCHRVDPSLILIQSRFIDLTLPRGSFEVIVFQESSQYMATRPLLTTAHALLADAGQLLILDEVETDRIASLISLANECGFELLESTDVTPMAAPSLNVLIGILERHRALLLNELGCSGRAFDMLMLQLHKQRAAYQQGSFSYRYFALGKILA